VARRLDAAADDAAQRDEAAQRRLGEIGRQLEAAQRRLDEIGQQSEAAQREVPDLLQARLPPRAPIRVGDEFLVRTPDGYLLLPAEDVRLLAAMSEGGVLEPGTRRVLATLLRPSGVFLDVGAHAGTMTLLGARCVGGEGRVFAVEPLPRLAGLLRRSLALNDAAERVSVSACAAGEGDAEATLHVGEVLGHSSLLPLADAPESGAVRVPVRRVDDLVPAGTRVDVAKIDAEGTELQVWRGMQRVVAESPDLAAVLEFGPSHLARAGVTPEAWLGELEASGFESFTVDEATGVCRPASAPALAGVFSVNILLLRPGAASRHPDLAFA
ncbi:MAG: FkbM family methyltransferase, partial [Acetobacteraceae bacterium]|nr:FkbM family methyltransferase [Acetobacteraceae bacterium]